MKKLKRNVNLCYFLSNGNVYYMIKELKTIYGEIKEGISNRPWIKNLGKLKCE
jgi:hypothetical protein